MKPDSEHAPRWRIPALPFLLGAVVVLLAWQRLGLSWGRDFDPDELQHMHGGFSVASGLIPYVDYFEHHTPWFGWIAALGVRWLGADWDTLMAARLVSGVVSMAALGVTWGIARSLSGKTAGLVALVIHGTFVAAIDKGIEIRPDVPAALLFGLTLLWGARALRQRGGFRSAILAGLALGSGLMFTPKLAFAAIGFGAGALVFLLVHGPEVRRRVPRLVALVLASCVPAAWTALALHRSGHFGAFFESVVLGPLAWKREVGVGVYLGEAFVRNPVSMALGALGLVAMFCRGMAFRKDSPEEAEPLLFAAPLAAAGLLVGWFVIPVPWPQYLLPLWPLLGVGAAQLIGRLRSGVEATVFFSSAAALLVVTYLALGLPWGALGSALAPAAIISASGFIAVGALRGQGVTRFGGLIAALGVLLTGAYYVQPHAVPWALAWCALALVIVLSPGRHHIRAATLVLVVAGPLVPIARLPHDRPVFPFRAEFDALMDKTSPSDYVLTGWRGCAVFRPHAYRFFFLHKGVTQMLSEEELGPMVLEALESTTPAAAVRDGATRQLSASVQSYLDLHYEPAGVGDLWLRTP